MNGIHAAFTGHIGRDAEVRADRDGKTWASFPVVVDAKTNDYNTIERVGAAQAVVEDCSSGPGGIAKR